ncbi:MAG TPA: hypothetical protein VLZ12_07260 [Verrucomicrobiae bacterium]|nr:hypothetical protein [Verrucomicrobiae bacterium]
MNAAHHLDSLTAKGLRTQLAAAFALTCVIPAMVVGYFAVNYILPQTTSLVELYSAVVCCLFVAALGSALMIRIVRQVHLIATAAQEFARAPIANDPVTASTNGGSTEENELLQLDLAFSKMSETLQRQVVELQEKTHQLTDLNTKLEDANHQLAQFNQMKSHLVLLASREFRNPIGTIMEAANLVLTRQLGDINEKQQRMIALIHTNACKAAKLLQEFLAIARVRAEGQNLDSREIDLAKIVDQLLMDACAETLRKALVVSVAASDDDDVVVQGNEHETTLALDCLLSNAVHLAAEKSELKVALRSQDDVAVINIDVRPLSVTARSFDRMVASLNNQTADPSEWSGCGTIELPLAKEIIQLLGGQFRVERTPDNVIAFHVLLPKSPANGRIHKTIEPDPCALCTA